MASHSADPAVAIRADGYERWFGQARFSNVFARDQTQTATCVGATAPAPESVIEISIESIVTRHKHHLCPVPD